MIERREFLTRSGALALAAATPLANSPAKAVPREIMQTNDTDVYTLAESLL
jgi:hypothetical protein